MSSAHSRRRLLLGAAGLAATTAFLAGDPQPAATTAHDARPGPKAPTPGPSRPPTLPPAATLSKPVFTLAGYREIVPGPAYAADAVALTIDDGPHPVWTPKILNLLERYHVQATFCLIGNQVLGHEGTARSVARAGHHLANHTYSHPTSLPKLAVPAIRKEIERAQDKIYSATAYAPRLFRSPGGSWSAAMMKQVAQSGLIPVDWTDDPNDWKRPGTASITKKLLAARPGDILLCHDGGGDRSQTYAALQTVIPALIARGYTFVSL
ncbi:polysaccharide deacetylase family protein [Hamadaea tsunoensis]|uniref:polysaccharide deacetylase family protein n=1 Tax=Hamadaea tsunoensis TaxID=53368 RepID=UPI0007E8DE43|nr:polysaccharide deacetylase family protein [Hamadaea tsunoensis]